MVQSLLTHGKSENTADEKRDMRCFGDLSGPLNYIYYSNTFSFHIVYRRRNCSFGILNEARIY